MSDATTATPIATVPTTPKKTKGKSAAVTKKPRVKPSHPKTADMVTAAIKNLKERGGSSLQAIKKYISANYKVDAEKMAPFIRKYLKNAVTTGSLVQTKGKGASGSFKLSGGLTEKKVIAKPTKPKVPKVQKSKPTTAKPSNTTVSEKKSTTNVTKKAPAKLRVAKSTTLSKAKKTKKAPTKKPKAPKPKKVGSAKSPKKATPKKK